MLTIRKRAAVAGTSIALFALSAMAQAQVNRTFVSGKGTDASTCGLTAPCRTFAYALSQTNPKGEITVLDSAGYGTVTINKAVSIVNDGVGEAGITTATATAAITVTTASSDVVNLRGLTLSGAASAIRGFCLMPAAC